MENIKTTVYTKESNTHYILIVNDDYTKKFMISKKHNRLEDIIKMYNISEIKERMAY